MPQMKHAAVVDWLSQFGLEVVRSPKQPSLYGDMAVECHHGDYCMAWMVDRYGDVRRRPALYCKEVYYPIIGVLLPRRKKWLHFRAFVIHMFRREHQGLCVEYRFHDRTRRPMPHWHTLSSYRTYDDGLRSEESRCCWEVLQGNMPIEAFYDYLLDRGFRLLPEWPTPQSTSGEVAR